MVTIQRLERSQVDGLIELFARNHEGIEGTPPREAFDEAAQRARLERQLAELDEGTRQAWTIHVDGALAGDIGFNQVQRGKVQSANIGYMVDAGMRGRGAATAALRLVIDEAFTTLHLHRLDAGARVTNLASQRVLEKAGFRRVGVLEKHFFEDGEWRDHVWFELIGLDEPPSQASSARSSS